MSSCEIYTEYFCMQCQRLVEDPCNHFQVYPEHALKTLTTASGLFNIVNYDAGFSKEIVSPVDGTSTQSIIGFPTIEEAINYLTYSGIDSGMPTQSISGFDTIEAAINHIVASGISSINENGGTPTTSISGYSTLEDAIIDLDNNKVNISGDTMTGYLVLNGDPVNNLQASTKQYVDEEISSLSGSISGGASLISFTFGGDGHDNYTLGVQTKNTSYTTVRRFIFPGSNNVGTPSAIKAIVENSKSNKCGSIRIQDVTNNNIIAGVYNFDYNSNSTLIDLGSITNIPEGESVFELQLKSSSRSNRVYCYSLSINF